MEPITSGETTFFLTQDEVTHHKILCIQGNSDGFAGESRGGVTCCDLTPENAMNLRKRLPWLNPRPLGTVTSFGFGDRLGLATRGHIRAVKGTGIAPVYAQQSVRENARTGRTPQGVLDDAMWAVFEMDWRAPWGADADHVKETNDLPPFIRAGYSFYTIDPNQYVDNAAYSDPITVLRQKVQALPWKDLEISPGGLGQVYLGRSIHVKGFALEFQEETFLRAAAKYSRAIAHIKKVSDFLVENAGDFDLEASVDETDTPTSVHEHYFIATELRRLGVPFVSLAPRFTGSFEKGVDYIGDRRLFERELGKHAAVMQAIGGYKLSIHTGSDKFSLYSSIAQLTDSRVHVKTAGTSYLEALKVIAQVTPAFFREILDFSRSRYEIERASYHVSGVLDKVPPSKSLAEHELLPLFEHFDARQVLHVAFGSVLDRYGGELKEVLKANLALYEAYLQNHFERHLAPFIKQGRQDG